MGLSGLSLASQVRKAFYRIPESTLIDLIQRIHDECARRHVVYYLREGQPDVIRVLPCPITVLPDQLAYVHVVSLTILNALKRLPELYMQDSEVRELLRLTPGEEEWLFTCWGPSHRENNPVFGRLDALVDFISPMWKETLHFIEPNLSGIGGLHLIPSSERMLADLMLPVLQAQDSSLHLSLAPDIRELLMQEVQDHLEALGRPGRHVCFVEPKYVSSGIDEQGMLAQYFHERYGIKISHADPAELSLEGDEVYYAGSPIDLAYRDYPVYDLIDLEREEGISVEPMRTLFRQNRVISSITAEVDQKSCWEVFTEPRIAQKYFSADERQVFRRHVLWTRIVADRQTVLPDGQVGDLLPYVRREQDTLVLKLNRSYGGQGVLIGPSLTEAEWAAAVEQALVDPERWVVQQLANIPASEFPVLGPDGAVHIEPFYVVMGFAPTKYGLAILGRASQKQVVNVAQRGGMCVVMVGQPPNRLMGPAPQPAVQPAR
jgi:hypothetical protein